MNTATKRAVTVLALPSTAAAAGVAIVGAAGAAAVVRSLRRRRSERLQDRVVVITGSSRGLGLAIAEECARLGAKIVQAARDGDELDRAKALLVSETGIAPYRVLTVRADLRREEDATALIAKATEVFGRVDVLINNAGVITVGPVEQLTAETFHDVMDTNLFAGVHCSLAVLPQMLDRHSGTIVNIASIGGKVAVPHMLPYTASKFAVVGFSQGLYAELHSKGVDVLTVCPGLMRTGSHIQALFSGDAAREYRWFSLMASLPGMSVSARFAAKKIVRAMLRGETEIAITPQAVLAARAEGSFPALTTKAMAIANHLLPDANAGGEAIHRGSTVRDRELWPASSIGQAAARRYNQLG